MKALISRVPGPPETLEYAEMPDPVPQAGEVLIRTEACALNFPDVLVIEDKYQYRPERPFAPGGEVSGVIEAVGEGVETFKPGDRVIADTRFGGMATLATADANDTFPLPQGVSATEGAALLFTYGTTIYALLDRGELKAGDTLLVLGAAGGIGMSAVEIGKAVGARVIGAVSSQEKADAIMAAGADGAVIYPRGPLDKAASKALAAEFKAAVGEDGANVIYDPVGGDYAEPALRSIAWEGRYLVTGFTAGIPRLPLNLTLLKSCDVRGVFWGAFARRFPDKNRAYVAQLFDWWAEGKVRPRVSRTWPLSEGAEAIKHLASRQAIGKVVVTTR
ncbi:NADPH:quinone oxidoreductase family protein [Acuticoccus sp. I52.16.1]|uniref:NADPH:quinone oxidoreductase family protein n=1 Tax=Acuticoccus sp. I52.16.1 TaxID=2928472 RepID=UPI001FD45B7A|nr:NADPH:quinone oxidoreductase family protein [Acuticoccus sp. I52.16.1]UOM33642.1 NADPH:quinone oxidoreductase family protein [Acuticoccus sp. I52.16.1]